MRLVTMVTQKMESLFAGRRIVPCRYLKILSNIVSSHCIVSNIFPNWALVKLRIINLIITKMDEVQYFYVLTKLF